MGLDLEPFQRTIVEAPTGDEHETVILLPRGQGKTSLVAALALHQLVTTLGAAVYCAAASREQARILFEAADRYARALDSPHVVHRHLELRWCDDPDEPRVFSRHLRVLAADAPRLHGLTYSLAIVDELQAHATDDSTSRSPARCTSAPTRGSSSSAPPGRAPTVPSVACAPARWRSPT